MEKHDDGGGRFAPWRSIPGHESKYCLNNKLEMDWKLDTRTCRRFSLAFAWDFHWMPLILGVHLCGQWGFKILPCPLARTPIWENLACMCSWFLLYHFPCAWFLCVRVLCFLRCVCLWIHVSTCMHVHSCFLLLLPNVSHAFCGCFAITSLMSLMHFIIHFLFFYQKFITLFPTACFTCCFKIPFLSAITYSAFVSQLDNYCSISCFKLKNEWYNCSN